MITRPGIRIIILPMHPRTSIIPSIHIPMPIRPTRIHPLPMMSLAPISPIIHVLIVRPSTGVIRCGPVAVVVGRCAVGVVVRVGPVAASVASGAVARGAVACCSVAGCVVVAGGRAVARGAVGSARVVVGVAGGAVGGTCGAVGVCVGVVGHFGIFLVGGFVFFPSFCYFLIYILERNEVRNVCGSCLSYQIKAGQF